MPICEPDCAEEELPEGLDDSQDEEEDEEGWYMFMRNDCPGIFSRWFRFPNIVCVLIQILVTWLLSKCPLLHWCQTHPGMFYILSLCFSFTLCDLSWLVFTKNQGFQSICGRLMNLFYCFCWQSCVVQPNPQKLLDLATPHSLASENNMLQLTNVVAALKCI